MKVSLESKLLKLSLYIVFISIAVMTATMPVGIELYFKLFYDSYYLSDVYRSFLVVFLMATGVIAEWIVVEMILMLRSIPSGPFTLRTVRALRRVGSAGVLLALMFVVKCLYYFTILTFVFGLLMLICSLFAFTLAGLFSQAVKFKEENDLTI